MLPLAGERHCRSGSLCGLEVVIARLAEPAEGQPDAEGGGTDADGLGGSKVLYEGMTLVRRTEEKQMIVLK